MTKDLITIWILLSSICLYNSFQYDYYDADIDDECHEDHCFSILNHYMNWFEAMQFCERKGKTILTMETRNRYMIEIDSLMSNGGYWIAVSPIGITYCAFITRSENFNEYLLKSCTANKYVLCEKSKISTTSPAPLYCPNEWFEFDQECFKVILELKNWTEARNSCQQFEADLFIAAEEITFDVLNLILKKNRKFQGDYKVWIGLQRINSSFHQWSDNTTVKSLQILTSMNNQSKSPNVTCFQYLPKENIVKLVDCSESAFIVCKKHLIPGGRTKSYVSSTTISDADTYCGTNIFWRYFNGNCYIFKEIEKSWFDARTDCNHLGGDLVSIGTLEEQQFLETYLKFPDYTFKWIGLNNFKPKYGFQWNDGSNPIFLNWASDKPDTQRGNEACTGFDISDGKWSNYNCQKRWGYWCERANNSISLSTPVSTSTLPGYCQSDWKKFGNKCYKLFGINDFEMKTWFEAQKTCLIEEGNLVSIHSTDENYFIVSLLINTKQSTWIGLNDIVTSGTYYWTDNSPYDFYIWDIQEPNGRSWNSRENCVEAIIRESNIGKWNDVDCMYYRSYICQKDIDPSITSPAPSTICGQGYIEYSGDCYKFTSQRLKWEDALGECRKDGGELMFILNEYEEAFLRYKFNIDHKVWIGLFYKKENEFFSWSNGWPVNYTNWRADEPTQNDRCVSLLHNMLWTETLCTQKLQSICRITKATYIKSQVEVGGKCPKTSEEWITSPKYCYLIQANKRKTFEQGEIECAYLNAQLASFGDYEELNFIKTKLINVPFRNFWIGLSRSDEGHYEWLDHSPITYTVWSKGEPSLQYDNEPENCIELTYNGKWNDLPCSYYRGIICRTEKQSLAEAASQNSGIGTSERIYYKTTIFLGVLLVVLLLIIAIKMIAKLFIRGENSPDRFRINPLSIQTNDDQEHQPV